MKKIILLFSMIYLGATSVKVMAESYTTKENYTEDNYLSAAQKKKFWVAVRHCHNGTFGTLAADGFGTSSISLPDARQTADKDCKVNMGNSNEIHNFDIANEELTLVPVDVWYCFNILLKSTHHGMTEDETKKQFEKREQNNIKCNRVMWHEKYESYLRPEINKIVARPHIELDPSADEIDPNGAGAVKVATITNVETTGSPVRYTCIYTANNEFDHLVLDNDKLSKSCTIKFENGKLILRAYPIPEFRNQSIAVMARRVGFEASQFSNFVPLGNMCKSFDKLDVNNNCITPPLPPLVKPEIRVVSDNAADGRKTVEISMMARGAKYICKFTSEKGEDVKFNSNDCKIDNQYGKSFAYTRTFTVGAALNGNTLEVLAEKEINHNGSKANIKEKSNAIFMEDTVAKNCSYTNVAYSKDTTGMLGTLCYPYPPCETPTANDFKGTSFIEGSNGVGIAKILFSRGDIYLNRSIEVLDYSGNVGETIGKPDLSADLKGIRILDNVQDPRTDHYDYRVYRTCKDKKSPDYCLLRVYNDKYTAPQCIPH